MTRFPCDDDPADRRIDWLAVIREAKKIAAQPGTPKSVKRRLVGDLEKAARYAENHPHQPVSSSTLRRAAREIEGKRS